MLLIVRAAVPELVTVTVWAVLVVPTFWLLKTRLVGFNVTPGALVTPVPLKAIVCGLPVALSVRATDAVLEPVALGVKVTLIVQDALAASDAGQLFV